MPQQHPKGKSHISNPIYMSSLVKLPNSLLATDPLTYYLWLLNQLNLPAFSSLGQIPISCRWRPRVSVVQVTQETCQAGGRAAGS